MTFKKVFLYFLQDKTNPDYIWSSESWTTLSKDRYLELYSRDQNVVIVNTEEKIIEVA